MIPAVNKDFGKLSQISESSIIDYAQQIWMKRLNRTATLARPDDAKRFITPTLGPCSTEKFMVIYLDNQHNVIQSKIEFSGTIDGAAVYPRVIVKHALECNAAAVILAHNHPSGITEPSTADIRVTERICDACELIDVRVLDHFIVGHETISMAEKGLI